MDKPQVGNRLNGGEQTFFSIFILLFLVRQAIVIQIDSLEMSGAVVLFDRTRNSNQFVLVILE